MRAFFAVELSPGAHETVARGLGGLRRRLGQARWVRAEGLHITLRFLGEQSGDLLEHVAADAAAALAGEAPVEVALGGGGFFPHERRPRVAWLGGVAPGMERWAAAIERCATAAGLEPEPRAFTPHVTLARLDRPWGAGEVETFRVAVGKWRLAPYTAREVVLFASDLRPAGAVYTAVRRLAVGGREGGPE